MPRFRRIVFPLLALTLSSAACDDLAGPDHVLVTVVVAPERIVPGDTAIIGVRFTNTGPFPVKVDTWCRHLFEVANAQGEVVVGREPLICIAIIGEPVVLAPFESIDRRIPWTGTRLQSFGSLVMEPLPPGRYLVYGKLDGRRSAPDAIEIQAP
jgi:hypothetical protein